MNTTEFEKVLNEQLKRCTDILVVKAREYATEDRLHNFRVAAALQGVSMEQALAAFMCKHTVSIFDMCRNADYDFATELWDEKITDHINYLILLRAVVEERNE